MKKFVYVIFACVLLPVLYSFAEMPSDYPSMNEIDNIINNNDYSSMDSLCVSIAAMDTDKRCHKYEVMLLHKILDRADANFLLSFLGNKIGLYDKNMDSITPVGYFVREPLEEKLERLNYGDSNRMKEIKEHISLIIQFLPFFQDSIGNETYKEIVHWLNPEKNASAIDSLPSITIDLK